MKKAVIFDFFGVICGEVAPRWFKRNLPNVDLPELQQNIMLPGDLGHKSLEQLYDELGKMVTREPKEIAQEFEQLVTINPELVSYIKDLGNLYKIGLCSNAFGSFLRPILESHNLIELFDTIVISSEVGYAKPQEEVYIMTAKALGVKPEECIFIDDNKSNIAAASSLGMQGIVFTSNQDVISKLS